MKIVSYMPQVIKLDSQDLGKLIRECVEKVIKEGLENDVCPKLAARIKKFGEIKQKNLPDGLNVRDLEDEDIDSKLTKAPTTQYSLKLASGYYVGVVPSSERVKNILNSISSDAEAREKRKAEVDAEPLSQAKKVPYQSPEDHAEEVKKNGSPERPLRFRTMKQVQEYIQEKYGEYLEFLTTRTRSGREFVYQARITYIAASYADGPSDVADGVVEKVTELLRPFGFYYAGNREDHDERQFSSNGWHVWKREGATDPYERWLMRQARDEDWR